MSVYIERIERDISLIQYGNWSIFKERLLQADQFSSEKEILSHMGIEEQFYNSIIAFAVHGWRNSTSRSLFQSIGNIGYELPVEGQVIFQNHLEQTRFFHRLDEGRFLCKSNLSYVKDENDVVIKVKGENALTYPEIKERRDKAEDVVNRILQVIYLYVWVNKKKERNGLIKLPKKLYRGIRLSDVMELPVLKEELANIQSTSTNRHDLWSKKVEIVKDFIEKHGLNGIAESQLVSFSASKSIAKYFANKRGLVIEILTKDVEILTSELHDDRFKVKDWVSKRLEREYIVKIPKEKVKVSQVYIEDLDFLVFTNNPMAVNLFNHDDKVAYYKLNGVSLKAQFHWSGNTKGSISYYNLDDNGWGYGSREFKETYGFSPLITASNIKEVENFWIQEK